MSSTRLPHKVMRPICGEPMLFRQLERLRDSKRVDRWLVVTSSQPEDEVLVDECRRRGWEVFTGSLHDVLDRFYQAAVPIGPDQIVRVTGDCPLIDPEIIDQLIDFHLKGGFEYSSNALEPTFPDGLDCEIIEWNVIKSSWENAKIPSEREHVTPYIYKGFKSNPRFRIGSFKGERDLSHLRWTVDESQDLELVVKIYEALYLRNSKFRTPDILNLLEQRPELKKLNSSIERNEGYRKSLEKDRLPKP